jgi:hypothetical protein
MLGRKASASSAASTGGKSYDDARGVALRELLHERVGALAPSAPGLSVARVVGASTKALHAGIDQHVLERGAVGEVIVELTPASARVAVHARMVQVEIGEGDGVMHVAREAHARLIRSLS